MRRLATLTLVLGLLALLPAGSTGGVAAATQPFCGIRWGSLPERHLVSTYTTAPIENLRAGRHACFDRLVVDLGPTRPGVSGRQGNGYQVSYVREVRDADTGERLPMSGGAILSVVVNAAAHDENLRPTYDPRDHSRAVSVTGFRTLRQVRFLGSFESQTAIAIGVRARLPFRVFILSGPGAGSRVVIDVAHRW